MDECLPVSAATEWPCNAATCRVLANEESRRSGTLIGKDAPGSLAKSASARPGANRSELSCFARGHCVSRCAREMSARRHLKQNLNSASPLFRLETGAPGPASARRPTVQALLEVRATSQFLALTFSTCVPGLRRPFLRAPARIERANNSPERCRRGCGEQVRYNYGGLK